VDEAAGMSESVVVVGAGLAGLRTAEELRRAGYTEAITLVGSEPHKPYDRPPLSKDVLTGKRSVEEIALRGAEFFTERNVSLRLGDPAVGLDLEARKVEFGDGARLGYDKLVIATGLVPKRLPFAGDLAGVHVLRTIDDVLGLLADAGSARSALIVGAGFIGCEVAAGLKDRGLDVVMVEPQEAPLAGALGATAGALVARLHTEAGVDLRCGVGVTELLGEDRVRGARLSDGSEVAADIVISGIGSAPAIGWLAESGLALGDGVLCDERGRASEENVWAVGDVAAWQRPGVPGHVRIEHWTGAGEQAAVVARDICGTEHAVATVPYFWSDQYGTKIQALGHFRPDDAVEVLEDDGRKFLVRYTRDGVLTGVAGCGMAGKVMKFRPQLA
jgi:3-phenylpropionate/trans-cinnamate dioxygenase ferredoxin reductase component